MSQDFRSRGPLAGLGLEEGLEEGDSFDTCGVEFAPAPEQSTETVNFHEFPAIVGDISRLPGRDAEN